MLPNWLVLGLPFSPPSFPPTFLKYKPMRISLHTSLLTSPLSLSVPFCFPSLSLSLSSTYLEVAHLLIFGELPGRDELEKWEGNVMRHAHLHEDVAHVYFLFFSLFHYPFFLFSTFHQQGIPPSQMLKTFRYDAHPMGMFISSMAALSTYYPEGNPCMS